MAPCMLQVGAAVGAAVGLHVWPTVVGLRDDGVGAGVGDAVGDIVPQLMLSAYSPLASEYPSTWR